MSELKDSATKAPAAVVETPAPAATASDTGQQISLALDATSRNEEHKLEGPKPELLANDTSVERPKPETLATPAEDKLAAAASEPSAVRRAVQQAPVASHARRYALLAACIACAISVG